MMSSTTAGSSSCLSPAAASGLDFGHRHHHRRHQPFAGAVPPAIGCSSRAPKEIKTKMLKSAVTGASSVPLLAPGLDFSHSLLLAAAARGANSINMSGTAVAVPMKTAGPGHENRMRRRSQEEEMRTGSVLHHLDLIPVCSVRSPAVAANHHHPPAATVVVVDDDDDVMTTTPGANGCRSVMDVRIERLQSLMFVKRSMRRCLLLDQEEEDEAAAIGEEEEDSSESGAEQQLIFSSADEAAVNVSEREGEDKDVDCMASRQQQKSAESGTKSFCGSSTASSNSTNGTSGAKRHNSSRVLQQTSSSITRTRSRTRSRKRRRSSGTKGEEPPTVSHRPGPGGSHRLLLLKKSANKTVSGADEDCCSEEEERENRDTGSQQRKSHQQQQRPTTRRQTRLLRQQQQLDADEEKEQATRRRQEEDEVAFLSRLQLIPCAEATDIRFRKFLKERIYYEKPAAALASTFSPSLRHNKKAVAAAVDSSRRASLSSASSSSGGQQSSSSSSSQRLLLQHEDSVLDRVQRQARSDHEPIVGRAMLPLPLLLPIPPLIPLTRDKESFFERALDLRPVNRELEARVYEERQSRLQEAWAHAARWLSTPSAADDDTATVSCAADNLTPDQVTRWRQWYAAGRGSAHAATAVGRKDDDTRTKETAVVVVPTTKQVALPSTRHQLNEEEEDMRTSASSSSSTHVPPSAADAGAASLAESVREARVRVRDSLTAMSSALLRTRQGHDGDNAEEEGRRMMAEWESGVVSPFRSFCRQWLNGDDDE